MRRDQLFLAEMMDAAEQAHRLAGETSVEDLSKDRQRRDALMWNSWCWGSLDSGLGRTEVPVQRCRWQQPARLRNRVVHGYWTIDLEILHVTAIDFLPGFIASLHTILLAIETDDVSGA
jgi:uncharacterized protein with HEPN domain